jgi:alginate O-acetyltransferase complex protein AlgI
VLFNSIQYLLFLPAVVFLYWWLPRGWRHVALLIASYFFYMSWMPSYGLLLGGLTLWNYLFGMLVGNRGLSDKARRLAFLAGITGNLGCLGLFKYTNFIADTAFHFSSWLAAWWHLPFTVGTTPWIFQIVLPLGISFFAFEFIHYLTDVYKGSPALVNPTQFALFAAFFPSQIAGPIKRFQDFQRQLVMQKPFDGPLFKSGLLLILQGMFKKVVLGDNLAQLVQPGFAAAAHLSSIDAWIAVAAFTLQIYYDFSGYTDIGRGSAMLFGYELPENFNLPYIAQNMSDFWRRWHISLSTWLRDYLYIPLGGSKGSGTSQMRNLVITMLLGGLWHGAAWHYVIWGAYHGVGLVVTHCWHRLAAKVSVLENMVATKIWDVCARVITLLAVVVGWVVFRADDLGQAMAMYASMLGFHNQVAGAESICTLLMQSAVPAGFLAYGLFWLGKRPLWAPARGAVAAGSGWRSWLTPPTSARAVAFISVAMLIVCFAPRKAIPFIYFQF